MQNPFQTTSQSPSNEGLPIVIPFTDDAIKTIAKKLTKTFPEQPLHRVTKAEITNCDKIHLLYGICQQIAELKTPLEYMPCQLVNDISITSSGIVLKKFIHEHQPAPRCTQPASSPQLKIMKAPAALKEDNRPKSEPSFHHRGVISAPVRRSQSVTDGHFFESKDRHTFIPVKCTTTSASPLLGRAKKNTFRPLSPITGLMIKSVHSEESNNNFIHDFFICTRFRNILEDALSDAKAAKKDNEYYDASKDDLLEEANGYYNDKTKNQSQTGPTSFFGKWCYKFTSCLRQPGATTA